MAERLVSGKAKQEDESLDTSLRPRLLNDFVGQDRVKENLVIAIQAATMRDEPLDHVLLYGPPGLGKTTLGHIIAQEMGANIRVTAGPAYASLSAARCFSHHSWTWAAYALW